MNSLLIVAARGIILAMSVLTPHLETKILLGGEELRIVPGQPVSSDELLGAARKLGWPLPEDYSACLTTHGAANILGAELLEPSNWRARSEPLSEDPVGRMANFLPFARRPIPTGGELLFCFRFEAELRTSAADMAAFSKGEARPTFHGASYQIVMCHLPEGLGGARLEEAQRPMAPTFSAWVEQIIAMVQARAAASQK